MIRQKENTGKIMVKQENLCERICRVIFQVGEFKEGGIRRTQKILLKISTWRLFWREILIRVKRYKNMKKIVLLFGVLLIGMTVKAQVERIELPLEMISVELPSGLEPPEESIGLGGGIYLLKMPEKHSMVIIKVKGEDKAIVIHSSFFISRFFVNPEKYFRGPRENYFKYNIEENDRRLVLWYKDNRIYCGYIYDKQYKVCQYFEKREKIWKRR